MDTSNPLKDPDHLLDDLESIRKLLGDDDLQPPLLTDPVNGEVQIPLLFDMVGAKPVAPQPVETPAEPAPVAAPATEKAPDALLLHLDNELRAAAQLILQDVINDFAPHIETEIKRRLEARMERLIAAATSN
ncbi:DNA polymerase III subunit chi [Pseudomonas sp. SDO528_S397]